MDKQRAQALSASLQKALEPWAKAEGVQIQYRGGKYGDAFWEPKLSIMEPNKNGDVETVEARAYKLYAKLEGLPEDGLGREFKTPQGRFEIIGFNPRGRKAPVLAKHLTNGKTYKFSTQNIRFLLDIKN